MIEVVTFTGTGKKWDTAEACTPEAALVAARQLLEDMRTGTTLDRGNFVRFYVDGEMVREVHYV